MDSHISRYSSQTSGAIAVERNLNGSLVLENGIIKRVYYGYSERDAVRQFKLEYKAAGFGRARKD